VTVIGRSSSALVDRIEIRQALDLDPVADGELAFLQAVGDVAEFRNSDAACHVPSRAFPGWWHG